MAKRKKNDPCPAVFRTDYERIREDLIDQLERNGTNGDTELFKKSRNINGFRACRIANNLY